MGGELDDVGAITPQRRGEARHRVYRYVPPKQPIAHAVTYIGDVLLEFTLRFTGSLSVISPAHETDLPIEDRATLRDAGATLHRIADGLYISAVSADRPTIESLGGHRFTHATTSFAGPRTRRFSGECAIELPATPDGGEPAISGTLGYALDVRALAPSDPPGQGSGDWLDRHTASFASIGAVVLEPVPVAAERAARLIAS